MSKHNRERRLIWRLGLHPKQTGRRATQAEFDAARLMRIQQAKQQGAQPFKPKVVS